MVDYKFSSIDGDNNMIINFYEGDITTENEYCHATDDFQPVARYRRTRLIETEKISKPNETIKVIQTDINTNLAIKGTPIDSQNNSKLNAKTI